MTTLPCSTPLSIGPCSQTGVDQVNAGPSSSRPAKVVTSFISDAGLTGLSACQATRGPRRADVLHPRDHRLARHAGAGERGLDGGRQGTRLGAAAALRLRAPPGRRAAARSARHTTEAMKKNRIAE